LFTCNKSWLTVDVCKRWRGRRRISLRVSTSDFWNIKIISKRRGKRNNLKIKLTYDFAIKDFSCDGVATLNALLVFSIEGDEMLVAFVRWPKVCVRITQTEDGLSKTDWTGRWCQLTDEWSLMTDHWWLITNDWSLITDDSCCEFPLFILDSDSFSIRIHLFSWCNYFFRFLNLDRFPDYWLTNFLIILIRFNSSLIS